MGAVKPYGAFVEIMGMSGLLHISQISYDRVENLEATLAAGMAIKCMVIDHDKAAGRIALSTKTLEPEPGDMLRDPERVFASQMKPLQNTTPALRLKSWLASRLLKKWS